MTMTLRDAIHEKHVIAESTRFTKLLLSGFISEIVYNKLLVNLYYIYSVLEDKSLTAGIITEDIEGICRSKLIKQDLDELNIQNDFISETTSKYIKHINTISEKNPQLLMAHIYIRHFGDMYGGQMIKKVVPGSGKMYEFENKKDLIEKVRARLDISLADEANVAMQFAIDLFEELADELHL